MTNRTLEETNNLAALSFLLFFYILMLVIAGYFYLEEDVTITDEEITRLSNKITMDRAQTFIIQDGKFIELDPITNKPIEDKSPCKTLKPKHVNASKDY